LSLCASPNQYDRGCQESDKSLIHINAIYEWIPTIVSRIQIHADSLMDPRPAHGTPPIPNSRGSGNIFLSASVQPQA
jgi:hypothetical protein